MATLTIRNVPEETRRRLRIRAARHGRSMEAELREIVDAAIEDGQPEESLADAFRRYFGPLGGVDLELPERTPAREPPDFSE